MRRQGFLSAAVALAAVALAAPVHAQQAAAYQTRFDTDDGWYLGEYAGVSWGIDANPIPGFSQSNSLNYNNGVDYDTGDYVYGVAFSPDIDISSYSSATLRFQCRYQTEDPLLNPGRDADSRFLMIMDATGEVLYSVQLTGSTCGSMDEWHPHQFDLDPAWGAIRLFFYFDSGDGYANDYQGWFIDDLSVGVPDVTPPAAVANLAAGAPTTNTMKLTWTAPADDDISGAAASFDLRFSTSPITAGNFAAATAVAGEPVPGVAGTPHQLTVSGLAASTTYYFALRATDKSGNVGPMSNAASGTTTGVPVPPQVLGGTGESGEGKDRYAACSVAGAGAPGGLLLIGALAGLALLVRRLR